MDARVCDEFLFCFLLFLVFSLLNVYPFPPSMGVVSLQGITLPGMPYHHRSVPDPQFYLYFDSADYRTVLTFECVL